jgi:CheY-like chemotaxis protein
MPEMDGLEASKIIQKEMGESAPLIIAMTANAMEGDKESYMDGGMDDYLSKPMRIIDIQNVLLRWEQQLTDKEVSHM